MAVRRLLRRSPRPSAARPARTTCGCGALCRGPRWLRGDFGPIPTTSALRRSPLADAMRRRGGARNALYMFVGRSCGHCGQCQLQLCTVAEDIKEEGPFVETTARSGQAASIYGSVALVGDKPEEGCTREFMLISSTAAVDLLHRSNISIRSNAFTVIA